MPTYIADEKRLFTLVQPITFQSLENLLSSDGQHDVSFPNLDRAIQQLDFDFYNDLLPAIARWASDHSQHATLVEPLRVGTIGKVTYTAAQVRYILANAFFLNTTSGYGDIDLSRIYNSFDTHVAVARIRCLIEYFRLSSERSDQDDRREISFERYSFLGDVPHWSQQNVVINASKCRVFTDRMESAVEAQGFVDFANKRIHIHRIISSATQEEVLFSCCPEAFVAILLCEQLQYDEVVLLRGCKRFVDYSGYGDTFRYREHWHEQNPSYIQDILVIDACFSNQFSQKNIDRDLGKAWTAFEKSNNEIIVTGHWGCGIFGGDLTFKFLQQICVATVLGDRFKRLDYSVYGDEALALKFNQLLESLEKKNKTVADVYEMMGAFRKTGNEIAIRASFSDYVDAWMNKS